MTDPKTVYDAIADDLVATQTRVEHGRMMSSPGLTYDGKVFAFYWDNKGDPRMGFRLGRDYDLTSLAAVDWSYLAPFKTKPPMKDWIVVGATGRQHWFELSARALEEMRDG